LAQIDFSRGDQALKYALGQTKAPVESIPQLAQLDFSRNAQSQKFVQNGSQLPPPTAAKASVLAQTDSRNEFSR